MFMYGQYGMDYVKPLSHKPAFYPNPQPDEIYWVPTGWTPQSRENVCDIGVVVAAASHPWKRPTGGRRIDLNFWVFQNEHFAIFTVIAYTKYYDNDENKHVIPIGISQLIAQKFLGLYALMEDDTNYNSDPNLVYSG